MTEQNKKRLVSGRDFLTGSIMLIVGLLACFEARSFDEASRLFPAVTAALLAAAGFFVALLAIVRPVVREPQPHSIDTPLLAALTIAVWAAAVNHGAGFIAPTFLMQLALFRIAGIRDGKILVSVAALVAGLAYLLFVVLLNVPLPPSLWPSVFQGF